MSKQPLTHLRSVGPAIADDLVLLGIRSVPDLVGQDADRLYEELCTMVGQRVDICVRDVFACAIAQAENPDLEAEQRDWWYWSRKRKGQL